MDQKQRACESLDQAGVVRRFLSATEYSVFKRGLESPELFQSFITPDCDAILATFPHLPAQEHADTNGTPSAETAGTPPSRDDVLRASLRVRTLLYEQLVPYVFAQTDSVHPPPSQEMRDFGKKRLEVAGIPENGELDTHSQKSNANELAPQNPIPIPPLDTRFYTLEQEPQMFRTIYQRYTDRIEQDRVRASASGAASTSGSGPGTDGQGNQTANGVGGQRHGNTTTQTDAGLAGRKYLVAEIDAKLPPALAREMRALLAEVRPSSTRSKWGSESRVGQEELYEALEKVLNELKAYKEHSYPFLTKVQKKDVPDYYDVVKRPMDLGTMSKNLKNLQYISKSHFAQDLNLIWANAHAYNPKGSIFRAHADAMRDRAEELLKAVPDIKITVRIVARMQGYEEPQAAEAADADEESDEENAVDSSNRASGRSTKTIPGSRVGASKSKSSKKNAHSHQRSAKGGKSKKAPSKGAPASKGARADDMFPLASDPLEGEGEHLSAGGTPAHTMDRRTPEVQNGVASHLGSNSLGFEGSDDYDRDLAQALGLFSGDLSDSPLNPMFDNGQRMDMLDGNNEHATEENRSTGHSEKGTGDKGLLSSNGPSALGNDANGKAGAGNVNETQDQRDESDAMDVSDDATHGNNIVDDSVVETVEFGVIGESESSRESPRPSTPPVDGSASENKPHQQLDPDVEPTLEDLINDIPAAPSAEPPESPPIVDTQELAWRSATFGARLTQVEAYFPTPNKQGRGAFGERESIVRTREEMGKFVEEAERARRRWAGSIVVGRWDVQNDDDGTKSHALVNGKEKGKRSARGEQPRDRGTLYLDSALDDSDGLFLPELYFPAAVVPDMEVRGKCDVGWGGWVPDLEMWSGRRAVQGDHGERKRSPTTYADYAKATPYPSGKEGKGLAGRMDQNVLEFRKVQEIHSKIVAKVNEQPGSQSQHPPSDSERPNPPGYKKSRHLRAKPLLTATTAEQLLRRSAGRILVHNGFQSSSGDALREIAGVMGQYLMNLGKLARVYMDGYGGKMSDEDILRHALLHNGVSSLNQLSHYIRVDVLRHGQKVADLRSKLEIKLEQLLQLETLAGEDVEKGDWLEDDDAFILGNLGDPEFDLLGLKEMGIETVQIPPELWRKKAESTKSKLRAMLLKREPLDNSSSLSAADMSAAHQYPVPPPFPPIADPAQVIAILRPLYEKRFNSANPLDRLEDADEARPTPRVSKTWQGKMRNQARLIMRRRVYDSMAQGEKARKEGKDKVVAAGSQGTPGAVQDGGGEQGNKKAKKV